jgi:hypothetical protein
MGPVAVAFPLPLVSMVITWAASAAQLRSETMAQARAARRGALRAG